MRAEDVRVAAEATRPEAVADHEAELPRSIVVAREGCAHERRDPEHVEQIVRGVRRPHNRRDLSLSLPAAGAAGVACESGDDPRRRLARAAFLASLRWGDVSFGFLTQGEKI